MQVHGYAPLLDAFRCGTPHRVRGSEGWNGEETKEEEDQDLQLVTPCVQVLKLSRSDDPADHDAFLNEYRVLQLLDRKLQGDK